MLHEGAEAHPEETLMPKEGGVVGGAGEEAGGLARWHVLSVLPLVDLVEQVVVDELPLGIQWRGPPREQPTPCLGGWREDAQGEGVVRLRTRGCHRQGRGLCHAGG